MPTVPTSPIYLDESQAFILVKCHDHDWYNACRFIRDEAFAAACAHEAAEHPYDRRQRQAQRKRHDRRVASREPSVMSRHRGSV